MQYVHDRVSTWLAAAAALAIGLGLAACGPAGEQEEPGDVMARRSTAVVAATAGFCAPDSLALPDRDGVAGDRVACGPEPAGEDEPDEAAPAPEDAPGKLPAPRVSERRPARTGCPHVDAAHGWAPMGLPASHPEGVRRLPRRPAPAGGASIRI